MKYKLQNSNVVKIRVTSKNLNWITDESGFDWLYDYDYNTGRALTIEDFIGNNDEPTPKFEAFCAKLKQDVVLFANDLTFIMFEPTDK